MSIQQLLKPQNVDNRSSRLYSYSQTVKELNLDIVGGPLDLAPPSAGNLGEVLTSNGAGGVVWGSPVDATPRKIESDDATSSITCNDVGIGGASMTSVGNLDMTGGFLRNVGLIDTQAASLNIITPTTDFEQGSSIIKLKTDSAERVIIDDALVYLKTKNYSEGVGGSGARLVLVDANGVCSLSAGDLNKPSIMMDLGGLRLSSLNQTFQRIMDATQDSAHVYSPSVGYQVYRDEVSATYQRFKDNLDVERMRISSAGVQINSAYTLPTADGLSGSSLQTNGAGVCSFVSPPPVFASYAKVIVSGVARQTLCSASIRGSLTIPANSFVLGSVWKLQAYGIYNVAPAQTIVLSILMNGIAVAFTPALAIANSPSPWSSSWVLTVQAVGAAGVATLASGSTNRLDSGVVCSNTVDAANFNTTVANVMDFTSTLSLAGDSITCESVSFSRIV